MKNNEYYWFIEPLDSNTNEIIARYLEQCGKGADIIEITKVGEIGIEGYYIETLQIGTLRKSIKQFNLKFRIWRKRGVNGKPANVSFLYDKEWQKKRKIAKIRKKIEEGR